MYGQYSRQADTSEDVAKLTAEMQSVQLISSNGVTQSDVSLHGSIQNAFSWSHDDDLPIESQCNTDADIIEATWMANRSWSRNRHLKLVSVKAAVDQQQVDDPTLIETTQQTPDIRHQSELLNKVAVDAAAVKLSNIELCLTTEDAVTVMHCMLLGVWHMSADDKIKHELFSFGAPVIFVDCLSMMIDNYMQDETDVRSSVSICISNFYFID